MEAEAEAEAANFSKPEAEAEAEAMKKLPLPDTLIVTVLFLPSSSSFPLPTSPPSAAGLLVCLSTFCSAFDLFVAAATAARLVNTRAAARVL